MNTSEMHWPNSCNFRDDSEVLASGSGVGLLEVLEAAEDKTRQHFCQLDRPDGMRVMSWGMST